MQYYSILVMGKLNIDVSMSELRRKRENILIAVAV